MTTFNPRQLRATFGSFATGVTVVTTRDGGGEPVGLTVNSLASVSLSPPLLVWCIGLGTPSFEVFRGCTHYAVNVLASNQEDISNRFATPSSDKFAGLTLQNGAGGAPLIAGCIASFECVNEIQYPGGDHLMLVGRILNYQTHAGDPLIFFGSGYAKLIP